MDDTAAAPPQAAPEPKSVALTRGAPRVAIVDPVSTGAHLAAAFARQGWSAVAVLSRDPLPRVYRGKVRAEDFEHLLTHTGDLDRTAARLAGLGVRAVLPGGELGVRLADQLTERLKLPGNLPALAEARRDKALMAAALADRGVPAPHTLRVHDGEQAAAAARALGWPVVAKPADSAGSDNVHIVHTPHALAEAVDAIRGSLTVFDEPNPSALVQEHLSGEQYTVNSVSLDGRHYIAEIWRDRRTAIPGGRRIYDRMDLLTPTAPLYPQLAAYTRRALTALGIRIGPAHTEIMLTAHGPVLIETGARLEGGALPDALTAARGQSQLSLTVQAYTDPASFAQHAAAPPPTGARVTQVFLAAPADTRLGDGSVLKRLRAIPAVFGTVGDLTPGRAIPATVCLTTSPGTVYLVASDATALERAYRQIRRLEREGLYTAEPGAHPIAA